jgi:hypothetical protein
VLKETPAGAWCKVEPEVFYAGNSDFTINLHKRCKTIVKSKDEPEVSVKETPKPTNHI